MNSISELTTYEKLNIIIKHLPEIEIQIEELENKLNNDTTTIITMLAGLHKLLFNLDSKCDKLQISNHN
jgi:hypothetical protein